jgi:osmotically-inducible protein OsmY
MRIALADKFTVGRHGIERRNAVEARAHRMQAEAQKVAKTAEDWRQTLSRIRRPRPSEERRQKAQRGVAMAAGAAGVAGAYFLDPDNGRRRRHLARDRATAFLRRRKADASREAQFRKGQAEGVVKKAVRSTVPEKPAPNDPALADRVKSEIFRSADAPKGSVNVNVEGGIVYLRGEVDRPETITSLVESANSVDGVRAVENFLHTPDAEAAMKADGGKG